VLDDDDVAGIAVKRKVFIPGQGDFARYLDLFTNTTAAAVTFSVQLRNNLGSNATTRVVAGSNGQWLITDDDAGDRPWTHTPRSRRRRRD
jgi:hypothetical protein